MPKTSVDDAQRTHTLTSTRYPTAKIRQRRTIEWRRQNNLHQLDLRVIFLTISSENSGGTSSFFFFFFRGSLRWTIYFFRSSKFTPMGEQATRRTFVKCLSWLSESKDLFLYKPGVLRFHFESACLHTGEHNASRRSLGQFRWVASSCALSFWIWTHTNLSEKSERRNFFCEQLERTSGSVLMTKPAVHIGNSRRLSQKLQIFASILLQNKDRNSSTLTKKSDCWLLRLDHIVTLSDC